MVGVREDSRQEGRGDRLSLASMRHGRGPPGARRCCAVWLVQLALLVTQTSSLGPPLSRARLLRSLPGLLLPGGLQLLPSVARAAAGEEPKITDKIRMDVAISLSAEETLRQQIVVGLYGDSAPVACATFKALAGGKLEAPCPEQDESADQNTQRGALTKKTVFRACKAEEMTPVSYDYSQVWRVLQNDRVDFGQVAGKFALRIPPTHTDNPQLSHSKPGLLSVRRGGGVFDFSLTLAPNAKLDDTNIVIGEVLSGFETLEQINSLPIAKAAGLGKDEGTAVSRGKQCYYGSTDTFCFQNKPLKKVVIRTAVI